MVHDYVAGAEVEWDEVARAINNVWGVWGEINDLIRWMRDWNLQPQRPRELRFYPMDGSGNWTHARHAYRAVHDFAARVDAGLAMAAFGGICSRPSSSFIRVMPLER